MLPGADFSERCRSPNEPAETNMPYWGPGPDQSDYAFNAVGAYIYLIKERMMKDIGTVLEKGFPEQGMVASIACLRALGELFPKNLSVHFGKKDFAFVVSAFNEWMAKVGPRIPSKHREALLAEAQREFALFEERILKPMR
jgi:hypothetical protein